MEMLQILLQNTEKNTLNEDYQMSYFPSLVSSQTPSVIPKYTLKQTNNALNIYK
jgi:hypothetical protein